MAKIPGRLWRKVLLGPAYCWHKYLLARSKRWDAERQQAYTERKRRRRIDQYGEQVRTKAHYREFQAPYNRWCVKGLTKIVRTGGTTGSPFAFYADTLFRRQKERAYLFDIWADVGYQPFDLRLVFRGNVGTRLVSYDWLENAYVISPNLLCDANKESVREFVTSLPPFFLHVYPSSLFTFIDFVGEETFRQLPVRGVLAGSEAFPASQREMFERKFGLKVAHWYGHAEYAALARYCRQCGGFHFYPTYGCAELVPGDDGMSRIIATSYNLIGTRFVRYDTGDRARSSSTECPAPFFRADAIEGRDQEFFIDEDGRRRAFGPYLFGIHDEFWDRVAVVQFVQERPGEMTVKIVPNEASNPPWLEHYLRRRFGSCRLAFEYVAEIPRTRMGKHRYFVSCPREASGRRPRPNEGSSENAHSDDELENLHG